MSKDLRWTVVCGIAVGGLVATSAVAQTAPTTDAAVSTPGDIVVTAQRRSERQSQVPLSITALSAQSLSATGISEARALTQITPGLNFQSVGSSAQPLIRGIGSSGSSIGDSSNVAMYIDGVYQPFQAANYLRFTDIERIEVLKGPQGTLLGRNAAGGAISVTTLGPRLGETRGQVSASVGRFNDVQLNGFVSAPLGGKAALSLSGNYTHTGGYRRDIYLNKQLGYLRAWSGRAKLLVQPTETTTILLTGHYGWSNDLTTFGNQPLNGDAAIRATVPGILLANEPNTSSLNIVPINRVANGGASLKIDQDLGFATLTSLTAFSKARQYVVTDSDLSPAANSQSFINFGDDMISQDLTLTSNPGGPLKWLLGATYYVEDGFFYNRSYGGLTVDSPNPPLTSGINVDDIHIKAFAIFAEAEYALTHKLSVIVGGRYSEDTPRFGGARLTVATGLLGARVANQATFRKFTPRVSLRYAINPGLNAYATFSQGFKSGVFAGNQLQFDPVSPEVVTAYEVGLKGRAGPTVSFDLAGYYYDYKNVQFASFGATATQVLLRNAAKAEIYGFEANANWTPVAGLNFRGGLAYTHGEYTSFLGAQGFRPTVNASGVPIGGNTGFSLDATGKPLIRTPRWQANGTVSYETRVDNGAKVGGNLTVSYTDKMNHEVSGNFVQPAYTVVNANVSWTSPDDHLRATVFGTNIFDRKYIAGILVSGIATAVTYAKPASFGVRVEYMF